MFDKLKNFIELQAKKFDLKNVALNNEVTTKMEACIKKDVTKDIHPMVFDGHMYIAYKGEPIIREDQIKDFVVSTIIECQGYLAEYRKSELQYENR